MRKGILFFAFVLMLSGGLLAPEQAFSQDAKKLVEEMVQAVGGRDAFYALRDVEYTYTYHRVAEGKKDVSLERYVFDGELSWAKYLQRGTWPEPPGTAIQGYDGQKTWMTIDGNTVDDPKLLRRADFLRKTNFYWFSMMFKLLDPGVQYTYKGKQSVDGIDYHRVGITFGEGVGDVQDTYVLYINPTTKLVDRFLFTVMDFNVTEPFLMKVQYEEVSGLKLPAHRKYTRADWDGKPKSNDWNEEISSNIKFNNGFERSLFAPPSS